MLTLIIISIIVAALIGKLEYKDIKRYVREIKEKHLCKKRGEEGKDRGTGDKDQSAGGDSCQG